MPSETWLELQADRVLAQQRASVETAKLVATFGTGIAAAVVASALEVGAPSRLDRLAALVLVVTVLLTIVVVLLDRLAVADHATLLQRAQIRGWDSDVLTSEYRVATLKAVTVNETVVRMVRSALAVQLFVALGAGVMAAVSLLQIPS